MVEQRGRHEDAELGEEEEAAEAGHGELEAPGGWWGSGGWIM